MEVDKIIIGGATQPSTINTPSDIRDRVKTFEKIFEIDNPSLGATVWVEDEEREYRILSLKPKMIGGMEIADAAVDEVVPESEIISRTFDGESVADAIVSSDEAVNSIASAIAEKVEYDESTGTVVLL